MFLTWVNRFCNNIRCYGRCKLQDNFLKKTEFTDKEKESLYNVFYQTQEMMGETGMPTSYGERSLMIGMGLKTDELDAALEPDDDYDF